MFWILHQRCCHLATCNANDGDDVYKPEKTEAAHCSVEAEECLISVVSELDTGLATYHLDGFHRSHDEV